MKETRRLFVSLLCFVLAFGSKRCRREPPRELTTAPRTTARIKGLLRRGFTYLFIKSPGGC